MMDNIIDKGQNMGINFKTNIFNFIIRAIDIYKKYPDRLLKDLKSIFEQMKFDFKKLVKEKVGDTEDFKKFNALKDCSYYEENNSNNEYISEDNWNDELELYNDYFINDYKNTLILNISNSFIANNHNNKYVEKYPLNSKQRYDILSLMHNIDKTLEKKYSIFIMFNNTIKANNHDFKYYKIYLNRLERGNNTKNNNTFNIERGGYITCNNKNAELRTTVTNKNYNYTDSYDFSYIREISDLSQNMSIEEETVQKGNKEVIIKITNEDYNIDTNIGGSNFYNHIYYYSTYQNCIYGSVGRRDDDYYRETPEERKERLKEEREEKKKERERWKSLTPQEREEERKRIEEEKRKEKEEEKRRKEEERKRRKEEEKRRKEEEERKKKEAEEKKKREEEKAKKERERIAKLTAQQREEERKKKEEEERKRKEAEEERRRIEERNRRIRNGEICPYCYSSNIGTWKPGWRVFVGIITVGISEAAIHKRKCHNCGNYFSADYE